MMEKHSFGNPVMCGMCKQPKGAVWADFWHEAAAGNGICDDCLAKQPVANVAPAQPEDTKPLPPVARGEK